jgi:transposase-like protein
MLKAMVAAQAFFRSAKAVMGVTPGQVTTDGHGSYPRAIGSTLSQRVVHRTSAYKNNRRYCPGAGTTIRPAGGAQSAAWDRW